jgi:hypothetical protein
MYDEAHEVPLGPGPTSVDLEVTDVLLLSQGDEDAFFAWLNRLPVVERYEGDGRTLYISVNAAAVDEVGLREILALFRRYGVGLRQLAIFDRPEFADWFRSDRAYWYKEIFG